MDYSIVLREGDHPKKKKKKDIHTSDYMQHKFKVDQRFKTRSLKKPWTQNPEFIGEIKIKNKSSEWCKKYRKKSNETIQTGQKISANHITSKGLISQIYKEFIKIDKKNTNTQ